MSRLYTIEPKTDGTGFTMTGPDSSLPFSFVTIDAALLRIKSEEGDTKFKTATITKRHDGGVNVSFS